MVDEIINASPPNYRFPEAGLRVMVTNHFGPKTRLRMASRLIITEVQNNKNNAIQNVYKNTLIFLIEYSKLFKDDMHVYLQDV